MLVNIIKMARITWIVVFMMSFTVMMGCSEDLVEGQCMGKTDGTACDDENPCTQTDTCRNEVCRGSEPVICEAPPACKKAGICQVTGPDAGKCVYANLTDGSACSDGDLCTQTDTCQAGACIGTNPLDCFAGQCATGGTCNPVTGGCEGGSNKPDGTDCDDANACTQTDTCQSGVCTGSNPVVCPAPAACKQEGVCVPDGPQAGTCSYANFQDGTGCDDVNACTKTDICQAGVCMGTNPVVCEAAGLCFNVGTCAPETGVCSDPPKTAGSACDDGNLCTHTDECDGKGVCLGADEVDCTLQKPCMEASTCNPSNGFCEGGNPKEVGTICDDGEVCTIEDVCVAGGECEGGSLCLENQICDDTDPENPQCIEPEALQYQIAKKLDLDGFNSASGLVVGLNGESYVTGMIKPPKKFFDDIEVDPWSDDVQNADVLVVKYDPTTRKAVWARRYGAGSAEETSPSVQFPAGIALTKDGTIVVIGSFKSGMKSEAIDLVNVGTSPNDFLIGLRGTDGTGLWGKSFDNGLGGALLAVAANPGLNRIAICGYSDHASIDLVPGAVYGGGMRDLVVAMFNSDGSFVWGRQLGSGQEEECQSLVIDDAGDLYMGGKYDGELDLGLGKLPNPGSSFRRWMFIAKLDGDTGATLSNVSFGHTGGNHTPLALALDQEGKLLVAGNFSVKLSFDPKDPAKEIVSAGNTDAFVAKLDPADGYAHLWSVRLGSPQGDSTQEVAVTSNNDVIAVGYFNTTTTGAAVLTSAGSSDAFVLVLDGSSGSTISAGGYGDDGTQTATCVDVNNQGTSHLDLIEIAGELTGEISFPDPAGDLMADKMAAFLVFAEIQ